ncbi:hypothetical protein EVAR_4048_1 [Eumeta japonica]|uniref:Uncharacterized protein n=1 Tax=Eumeta variegata TaxID=151549 RepID=A0A4C1T4P0_EUMVA|nr:hypothetical protein EVAR_4048_1 [Eumeta japonica]
MRAVKNRWLRQPINIRNFRGVSNALSAYWVGIGYLMEREGCDGRGNGVMEENEPNATAEAVTSCLYSVRVCSPKRRGKGEGWGGGGRPGAARETSRGGLPSTSFIKPCEWV